MKLRVEISPECEDEEVVIRCRRQDGRVAELVRTVEGLISAPGEMALTLGDTEYYIPKPEILFFETADSKVTAHTANGMYYTAQKLFALEDTLPKYFVRVSKSCILNVTAISALSRNLTGASRVTFRGTEKVVYVSRSYYKILRERIEEIRFRT